MDVSVWLPLPVAVAVTSGPCLATLPSELRRRARIIRTNSRLGSSPWISSASMRLSLLLPLAR